MLKILFNSISLIALLGIVMFSSCGLEESVIDVDNYVNESSDEIAKKCMTGKTACFELVFPVTLNFPDGTSEEVDGHQSLRTAIKTWRENNPDAIEKPELAFPIDILNEDGELISVQNSEELVALKATCERRFPKFQKWISNECFQLVYPISIEFPDGSIVASDDADALKDLLQDWFITNDPSPENRPKLVYPFDVSLEDGTVQTITSKDDLKALKKSCRD